MSGAPDRPPRRAAPPGDPGRQEPRLDEPRLDEPRLDDPRLREPHSQASPQRDPQWRVPTGPDAGGQQVTGRGHPRVLEQPVPQPQPFPAPPPGMHPQQVAPQSAPRAAPDPQARWHDPHGGTYHPAYDPGYSALDQAIDVPHRPSPGPGYLPVDPVGRGYEDPRGPQPAHGWTQAGVPPAAPMPQAPPRMPRNMLHSQTDFTDGSRLPSWLHRTGGAITAGAVSAAATARGAFATMRARRSEKARERARVEAARAADALDAGTHVQDPGMRAPRRVGPKLTAKEKRWQRRRRRHVVEEIAGWILVPIILIALYFALVGGLSLFGLELNDLMDGLRAIWAQFG